MEASTPFASPRRAPVQGKRKASPIPIRPREARGITEKTQWGPWGALRAQVRRTKCGAALWAGSGRGIAGGFDKGDAGVVGGGVRKEKRKDESEDEAGSMDSIGSVGAFGWRSFSGTGHGLAG